MEKMIAFYVNNAVVHGITHTSPWANLEAATNACWAYCQELNTWWDHLHPGEVYMDELSIIADNIHLDGLGQSVRVCCVPDQIDNPPLPSFSGYEVQDLDWNDWVTI